MKWAPVSAGHGLLEINAPHVGQRSGTAAYSSRTTTLSDAPLASITEMRAKPAPSGVQADCRRRSGVPTGAPLTIQRNGGTPPCAFKARSLALSPALREPEIDACAVRRIDDFQRLRLASPVFGDVLAQCRKGGGKSAVRAMSASAG